MNGIRTHASMAMMVVRAIPPCHGEHMAVGMDALAVTGDSAIMRDVFPLARVIVLALKRAATVC